MKLTPIILLVLGFVQSLSGCSESDTASGNALDTSEATILEGEWTSACLDNTSSFSGGASGSTSIIQTFSGNDISAVVNTYTDNACTQLESSVPAADSSLFVRPEQAPVTFSIGDSVVTTNGVQAIGIDLIDAEDGVTLNIFFLENGNTLYFGIPACLPESLPCDVRPSEINLLLPYTKTE